jgi:hypothetical protein
METLENPDELTFEKWLTEFLYLIETSGYKEALDENSLRARFYDAEISARDSANTFLREKGL